MAWHCGSRNCNTHISSAHECRGWRLTPIHGSVGRSGKNIKNDVIIIQGALNRFSADCGGPYPRLATNGQASQTLFAAIDKFQKNYFGLLRPDGRVDVGGSTYKALARSNDVKRIAIDLTNQFVEQFENGRRIYKYDCVSGDSSHPTDKGVFRIFRKEHPYRSKKYDVQMDYAMFFTRDGKALHQYHGPFYLLKLGRGQLGSDFFGSHGCVRLEESDARKIYLWAPMNTRVTVF